MAVGQLTHKSLTDCHREQAPSHIWIYRAFSKIFELR